jgi:hypothetical protein
MAITLGGFDLSIASGSQQDKLLEGKFTKRGNLNTWRKGKDGPGKILSSRHRAASRTSCSPCGTSGLPVRLIKFKR